MRIKSCRSKQRKNVYFAPAGQLHNIAIEHLPSSDSTFIAEQINFYRLSSTRQLVMIKDKSHIKEAVLYGGLKYDADTTALVVRKTKNILIFLET